MAHFISPTFVIDFMERHTQAKIYDIATTLTNIIRTGFKEIHATQTPASKAISSNVVILHGKTISLHICPQKNKSTRTDSAQSLCIAYSALSLSDKFKRTTTFTTNTMRLFPIALQLSIETLRKNTAHILVYCI